MKVQDHLRRASHEVPCASTFFEINVINTGKEETLAALRTAGQLACNLNGSIELLAPQVVPYPLDLSNPPVARTFTARRFRTLAGNQKVLTNVQVILCRDRESAFKQALKPHSLVVIGSRKRWWRSDESRLVEMLRQQGHEVIMVNV
jgi:hypothetical protein